MAKLYKCITKKVFGVNLIEGFTWSMIWTGWYGMTHNNQDPKQYVNDGQISTCSFWVCCFCLRRLREMADGELKDMEFFFSTLPTPFTAFDSEAYKTSVVGECYRLTALKVWLDFLNKLRLSYILGLFMRHMLLAYNKLSFSQVYKLYKSLQQYYHSHYAKPTDGQVGLPALVADDSDMDLTSTEDTVGDRMDKEESDTPLHESELRLVTWWNVFTACTLKV